MMIRRLAEQREAKAREQRYGPDYNFGATYYDARDEAGSTAIINATEVGLDGVPPNSMFGDRATNEINWATHDPATLANNLRGMNILMYWGNGQPGPLDPTPPEAGAISIETLVNEDNIDFRNRLQSLQIPAFYNDYGPGTHSWPYWTRDLQESIGPIAEDFAHPPATPKSVTYTIADAQYSVFGWSVAMHRTAEEFSPPSLPPLEIDLHGGPEMAPKPPTLGAPREARGAPRK